MAKMVVLEGPGGVEFKVSFPDNVVNSKGEVQDEESFNTIANHALELRNNPPEGSAPKVSKELNYEQRPVGFLGAVAAGLKNLTNGNWTPGGIGSGSVVREGEEQNVIDGWRNNPLEQAKQSIPFYDTVKRMFAEKDTPTALGTGLGDMVSGIANSPAILNASGITPLQSRLNGIPGANKFNPNVALERYGGPSAPTPLNALQQAVVDRIQRSRNNPLINNIVGESTIPAGTSITGGTFPSGNSPGGIHNIPPEITPDNGNTARALARKAGTEQPQWKPPAIVDTRLPSGTRSPILNKLTSEIVPETVVADPPLPEIIPKSRVQKLADEQGISYDDARILHHPNDIIKDKRGMQNALFARAREKGMTPQILKDAATTTFNVDSLSKLSDEQLHSFWKDLDLKPNVDVITRTKKTGFTGEGKPVTSVTDAVDNVMNEVKP